MITVIIIRAVTPGDAGLLLSWRNDPETRVASLSSASVDWETHVAWLTRTLSDPLRTLYIGELGGTAIGTVRFDQDEAGAAEVSITVAPAQRGRRLSLPLLRAGMATYAAAHPSTKNVIARVREENTASRSLFAAGGFTEMDRSADGVIRMTSAPATSTQLSGEGPN
ncbi:GNAT family N-acetyltransferase [Microbacterium sp. CBA3102]|nr:GNAT family N-acetyltransferase [Microbacterium sp. CBA3102]